MNIVTNLNFQVLNKYLRKLGVSEDWSVVDVLGLDPELLEFLPKPVKALILLFPCSENVSYWSKMIFFFKISLTSILVRKASIS